MTYARIEALAEAGLKQCEVPGCNRWCERYELRDTPDGVKLCEDCAKLPADCSACTSKVTTLRDIDTRDGHCVRCEPSRSDYEPVASTLEAGL